MGNCTTWVCVVVILDFGVKSQNTNFRITQFSLNHDHVIKWNQWRRALMFSLIWAWTNGWVKNRDAGDLGGRCAHYDVIVMWNIDGYSGEISYMNIHFKSTFREFDHHRGLNCMVDFVLFRLLLDNAIYPLFQINMIECKSKKLSASDV